MGRVKFHILGLRIAILSEGSYLIAGKQEGEQNAESRDDPDDEDALVEDVVHGESHVRGELLHGADVLLHGEGQHGGHELLGDELGAELGRGHPRKPLVHGEKGHDHFAVF